MYSVQNLRLLDTINGGNLKMKYWGEKLFSRPPDSIKLGEWVFSFFSGGGGGTAWESGWLRDVDNRLLSCTIVLDVGVSADVD
jgi:hypothetical protein